jgi:hypothetical protein
VFFMLPIAPETTYAQRDGIYQDQEGITTARVWVGGRAATR